MRAPCPCQWGRVEYDCQDPEAHLYVIWLFPGWPRLKSGHTRQPKTLDRFCRIGTVMETLARIHGDRSAPTFAVEASRVVEYIGQFLGKGPA